MSLLFNPTTAALLTLSLSALGFAFRSELLSSQKKRIEGSESQTENVVIKPLLDFDIKSTVARPYRPWRPGKFYMTMGLQKMPEEDWLLLDNCYLQEQQVRLDLLKHHRDGVLQALPGSENACEEILEMITEFLTARFPQYFQFTDSSREYIYNAITEKTFRVVEPYEDHPLAIAAQLVMEDLNVIIPGAGEDPADHYLRASFSFAPAGWALQERIGWPLYRLHTPVPLWEEKLRKSVEKFFSSIKVDAPKQRHNFFIQAGREFFVQKPFPSSLPSRCKIEDIHIRHERQTFRRLPRTGAVLFAVRTYLTAVIELADELDSLHNLRAAVKAMPPEMARYKSQGVWGEVLEEYCEGMLGPWSDEEEI